MDLKIQSFTSDNDVINYINFLIINNLQYHFDDEIKDIQWSVELSDTQIDTLEENDKQLQDYCNIWDFFDLECNAELWERFKNNV